MGPQYAFVHVDVFTDRIFGGNPLAVVLDGRGLTNAEMQSIAREMNLSETTFVLPLRGPESSGGDRHRLGQRAAARRGAAVRPHSPEQARW
jgi:trans-2,3-dihydro-3-hydroxyanthranilate isomerase